MRIKVFFKTVVSLTLALCLLLFIRGISITRFPLEEGRREFYLRSSSSQAFVKQTLSFDDLFCLKGEKVSFACENEKEALAVLLDRYKAQVLFIEDVGGVRSYYCVSEKWQDGVRLNGVFINLHIAFDGERCALGSPIIFGGF